MSPQTNIRPQLTPIGFLENMDNSWYRYFFDRVYKYIYTFYSPYDAFNKCESLETGDTPGKLGLGTFEGVKTGPGPRTTLIP